MSQDSRALSTTRSTSTILERAQDLQNYILEGRILEAMHEFYDPACVMQENSQPATVGLEANIEREKAWLETVAEWKGFEVRSIAATGDVSFVESTLDYVGKDGVAVHGEQVSRAIWKDGRITEERFYHE